MGRILEDFFGFNDFGKIMDCNLLFCGKEWTQTAFV